jgi:CheY-like chemotaxis protein
MHKIQDAKALMEKCKLIREHEQTLYQEFVNTANAHNMSIRVGDTVLYVEDEVDSVSMLKALLDFACNGHSCETMRVVPTSDVATAKKFIEQNYLALKCVVLDLNLVVGDDSEALLDWIVNRYGNALPVIVYTADTTRIDAVRKKYDFVEILLKGSTSNDELISAVRRSRKCEVDGSECNLPTCGKCKHTKE